MTGNVGCLFPYFCPSSNPLVTRWNRVSISHSVLSLYFSNGPSCCPAGIDGSILIGSRGRPTRVRSKRRRRECQHRTKLWFVATQRHSIAGSHLVAFCAKLDGPAAQSRFLTRSSPGIMAKILTYSSFDRPQGTTSSSLAIKLYSLLSVARALSRRLTLRAALFGWIMPLPAALLYSLWETSGYCGLPLRPPIRRPCRSSSRGCEGGSCRSCCG